MGKKSAPPQPDYTALAAQQGAANTTAANQQSLLNNPNQITPYGSSQYTMGADGRPVRTDTLSPAQQALLERTQQAEMSSLGILNDYMPNIRSALSGGFGLSGSARQGFDPSVHIGQTQDNLDPNSAGAIQRYLDFSGAPAMPNADRGVLDQATRAAFEQQSRFLDPQFRNMQSSLDSDMANQGITRGSAAYDRAQNLLGDQRTQAYGNAENQAQAQGQAAMRNMFDMQLGARQQGVGERTTQGEFANSAQAQAFNNILQAMQANNAGVAQEANIASLGTQLYNQGRQQNFTEMMQNRTMPINMLTALLGTSQIQNPQYQQTAPTSIIPSPILQAGQLQGQAATAGSNAKQAMLGSILGGASTAAGAYFGSRRT